MWIQGDESYVPNKSTGVLEDVGPKNSCMQSYWSSLLIIIMENTRLRLLDSAKFSLEDFDPGQSIASINCQCERDVKETGILFPYIEINLP